MDRLIAHRGNNDSVCENNVDCLLQALNYDYISGIEVDIRKTLDDKLVLCHNSFVKDDFRLYSIARTSYKELKKNTYTIKNTPFYIHTLGELLGKVHSNKMILLDVKEDIDIDLFYKAIKKYLSLSIYICSFHYDFSLRLKRKYPHLKVGIIIGYGINKDKNIDSFDFISIHHHYLNEYQKDCFIWTINNPELLKKVGNCMGIITDNSYLLRNEVKKRI